MTNIYLKVNSACGVHSRLRNVTGIERVTSLVLLTPLTITSAIIDASCHGRTHQLHQNPTMIHQRNPYLLNVASLSTYPKGLQRLHHSGSSNSSLAQSVEVSLFIKKPQLD